MFFQDRDKEKFNKLHVEDILDLALLVPNQYENFYLSSSPSIGSINVIDVTIKSTSFNPKYFKLNLFSHTFNSYLNAIIFHPKKFHQAVFKSSKRLYLSGRLEQKFDNLQMIQPQIVEEEDINTIVPKYKTTIQNIVMKDLIKRYLNEKNLQKTSLSNFMIKSILEIHFPSLSFVKSYLENGYSKKSLYVLKYVEIFNHVKKLSKKKSNFKSKNILTGDVEPFIQSLPFELTDDQKSVISEIKTDLNSKKATKRVIMGDVGSGKTIIILSAVVIAYPLKSILMAPTTILANQLFEEAKKFLPSYFKIGFVTNKTSKKDNLKDYDFLIGTHALLYRELLEADLVMIDEQHRFGTKQRNMISKLVSTGEFHPHFLQFSATPIPRTLSMIQSNMIDISIIKEMPFKKDIETTIIGVADFQNLLEHIKVEIAHSRQIIIVYPLVEESEVIDYQSIDEAKEYWLRHFEKVYITHGKDKNKDSVLEEFRENGNILLATTLIEVGISLPQLSTIILVAPERLGLASLHQLRGRVGRNGLKGYCFLFTKQHSNKRLEEFSKIIDGFEIAELDLKYRDSGDLLKGELQSGKSFRWFDPKYDKAIVQEVNSLM